MTNLLITLLFSQNLFAKTYGGTDYDEFYSITQTSDGGYAVAGYTWSFGAGSSDFLVLKLASDGSLSGARTFGGTGWDVAYSITQTTDGGYVVAGYTSSFGAGSSDFLVLKLASDGSLSWARTFGGTDDDYAWSITHTSDGGYAVAGYTWSFGAGGYDFLVLKLASDGSLSWARTFGGTSWDKAYSITQTTDGGYVVAGSTNSFGAGYEDLLVLKLASDGSLSWARTFGGTSSEWAYSITQTADGGYAVAGSTYSFGAGGYDFLVLKLAPNGSLGAARTFGGAGYDYAYSITQTADGGYAVAGYTWSFGAGSSDFLVLKLALDGSLSWARTFGGTDDDYVWSITQSSDGGYAVAGSTLSFGAGGDDLVLKMGSDGSYPGCLQDCSPTVGTPSLTTSSPSVGADCSPSTSSPSPTVRIPTPSITDVCPSQDVNEIYPNGSKPWITCSPLPGGVLFISPEDVAIKIYKADGRLAYSGELQKGQNKISLETGVYLWITRNQSGKLAIR